MVIISKLTNEKILTITAIVVIPLAICCLPEVLKLEDSNKSIIMISMGLNSICCGAAIVLTYFIMKCKGKKKNENE